MNDSFLHGSIKCGTQYLQRLFFKPYGVIRPLGIKPSFNRDLHEGVVRGNRGVLKEFLEPTQLALSQAGGAKLVHSVRMILENKREFVAVKLDIKNAHNEVARSSIIEDMEREPFLRHLAWHVPTCLAATTSLDGRSGVRLDREKIQKPAVTSALPGTGRLLS